MKFTCDAPPDADGWKLPRPEEQARLISSLLHGEACVNIVSTMSLDAAILDRPVIGIEFHDEINAPREIMYSEYRATHYRPLVESGGLRIARTWNELMELLRLAISDPERDRLERAAMVSAVCGPLDGHSAERVADGLQAILLGSASGLQSASSKPSLAIVAAGEGEDS